MLTIGTLAAVLMIVLSHEVFKHEVFHVLTIDTLAAVLMIVLSHQVFKLLDRYHEVFKHSMC